MNDIGYIKHNFHHIILKICVSGNTSLLQYQQMPLPSHIHISVIKGNSSMEMSIAAEEFLKSIDFKNSSAAIDISIVST